MYNIRCENIYKIFKKYDELVFKYPKEIFMDINNYGDLRKDSKILEIGSGTGKATEGILDLNFNDVTCIELEYELGAYMDRKFNQNIDIYISSFEEWQNPTYKYHMIMCANSFHFLNPKIRLNKIKNTLKKDGVMALFWIFEKSADYKIKEKLNDIYNKINLKLFLNSYDSSLDNIFKIKKEIINKNIFYNFETKKYNWNKIYSVEEYIDMLNIDDMYYLLDDHIKKSLNIDIRNILKENNKKIQIDYEAILFLTKLI